MSRIWSGWFGWISLHNLAKRVFVAETDSKVLYHKNHYNFLGRRRMFSFFQYRSCKYFQSVLNSFSDCLNFVCVCVCVYIYIYKVEKKIQTDYTFISTSLFRGCPLVRRFLVNLLTSGQPRNRLVEINV